MAYNLEVAICDLKIASYCRATTYVDLSMNNNSAPTARFSGSTCEVIEGRICFIRAQRVMLDSDLAELYGVTTKRLNEQFRRNRTRFPIDFAFQIDRKELPILLSQIPLANPAHGGRRQLPWVFTEHGAIMLAAVLNSAVAIEASVRVVRAFVHLREMLASNKQLAVKFAELERRLDANDGALKTLFDAIRELLKPNSTPEVRREIGFHVKEQARRYRTRMDI